MQKAVGAESAEHSPLSRMQRCKVIPPTRQNCDHIRTSYIQDATNKRGGRMGETVKTTRVSSSTVWHVITYQGYPLFPNKTVCTEVNVRRAYPLDRSWSQTAHG